MKFDVPVSKQTGGGSSPRKTARTMESSKSTKGSPQRGVDTPIKFRIKK